PSVALDRQDRRPLVDGGARIVGLHELRPALRAPVELHDFRHAVDAVSDEPRENAPLALGPLTEVAVAGVEEPFRVAATIAFACRFAEPLDVLARYHLEPVASEYAVDLFGIHREASVVTRGASLA